MERFETIEKIPTWALCYIINGYEYDDEDTYYYINKFIFD